MAPEIKIGSMTEPTTPLPLTASRADQIFPRLTSAQIERVATHGRTRAVRSDEVLVEQGDRAIPFFVVISGELEAVRPTSATETLISIFSAGQFTGEINTLSGRRAMARMRAFILRRVELIAQGIGDATLLGSSHSAIPFASRNSSRAMATRMRTSIWNATPTFRASWITSMSLRLDHWSCPSAAKGFW